ncbi:YwqG family protein [Fictibacillus halophilus]|uniref:YwqG family protein n=1 Tax=Fictibacillus halophilus TaxID=1610490 RepID=UPI001CFA2B28|nr:YwqG family protein [Fictibacillus halophilus]
MDTKKYLEQRLSLYDIEDEFNAEDLLPLIQKAIGMKKKKGDCEIGASKFGGEPDLPVGTVFPEYNDAPLTFLCQINLRELSHYESASVLPQEGMLSFFFEAIDLPFVEKMNDYNSWHVFYFKAEEELTRTSYPDFEREDDIEYGPLPEYSIHFQEILTLPEEPEHLDLDEDATEAYWDFAYSLPMSLHHSLEELKQLDDEEDDGLPYHYLLGYPIAVQESPIEEVTYTHSNITRTNVDEDDYTLLLQLDYDEELDFIWGDVGKVYFIIKKDDLKNGNFKDVLVTWQCH